MYGGYRRELLCLPVSGLDGWPKREDIAFGGKVLLPPSVLETLSRHSFNYPMLFKIANPATGRYTHCGVLEFTSPDETACLPSWIMKLLGINAGDRLTIELVSDLPVATYTKFKPLSPLFLEITDPKAVLENSLRRFACLTAGDVFSISYNNTIYHLEVEETRPMSAVSIIECDMEVDFSPPEGYTEPAREEPKRGEATASRAGTKFRPFTGQGLRLDGKNHKVTDAKPPEEEEDDDVGIPDYDYKVGTLTYLRDVRRTPEKQPEEGFKFFSGQGRPLDGSDNAQ